MRTWRKLFCSLGRLKSCCSHKTKVRPLSIPNIVRIVACVTQQSQRNTVMHLPCTALTVRQSCRTEKCRAVVLTQNMHSWITTLCTELTRHTPARWSDLFLSSSLKTYQTITTFSMHPYQPQEVRNGHQDRLQSFPTAEIARCLWFSRRRPKLSPRSLLKTFRLRRPP